jgi:hypothetical protein
VISGAEQQTTDFYLLQRVAVGMLVLGVDEFTRRLRVLQQTIDADPKRVWAETDFAQETPLNRFAYFVLGSLLRAEKAGVQFVNGSLQTTQRATETAQNITQTAQKFTPPFLYNLVTRPFARPAARVRGAVAREVQRSVIEGRFEDKRSRALSEEAFTSLVAEVIDYMARNPELVDLIERQSMGLANTVLDNGREVGVAADDAVESALRRLLRLPPRDQLPDSPLTGVPQDMYDPARRMPSDEGE